MTSTTGPTRNYLWYLENNVYNLQHYLLKELFGYLIHSGIPTTNPDLKIADIGTGTGIWLNDLRRLLPSSVCLDGFYGSSNVIPSLQFLPANMKFYKWDIRSNVPRDLVGRYDIVHLRKFSTVLHDNEIGRVLRNVIEIIKPGGYLQWDDVDLAPSSMKTISGPIKDNAPNTPQSTLGQNPIPRPQWSQTLPYLFSAAGLERQSIRVEVPVPSPTLAIAMCECDLSVAELQARQTSDANKAEALRSWISEGSKEIRDGHYWYFKKSIVVGRKPEYSVKEEAEVWEEGRQFSSKDVSEDMYGHNSDLQFRLK